MMRLVSDPLRASPVVRLGWPVSNAWLFPEINAGPVLIDCGHSSLWPSIVHGMRRHGVRPRDLAAVILTHRHCDHAGNAALLSERYGVPIFAHRRDAEVLSGSVEPSTLEDEARLGRVMCFMENTFPAQPLETHPLEHGDCVLGFEVIEVPGHTSGSIFIWHEASRTLFTGDALLNAEPPLTVKIGMTLPYPAFCDDYSGALSSLRSFLGKALPTRRMCPGHGPMWPGDITDALEGILQNAKHRSGDFGCDEDHGKPSEGRF